jgi:hypothetical protein
MKGAAASLCQTSGIFKYGINFFRLSLNLVHDDVGEKVLFFFDKN